MSEVNKFNNVDKNYSCLSLSRPKVIKISHKEYSELEGWVSNNSSKHPLITVGLEVSE